MYYSKVIIIVMLRILYQRLLLRTFCAYDVFYYIKIVLDNSKRGSSDISKLSLKLQKNHWAMVIIKNLIQIFSIEFYLVKVAVLIFVQY